MLKAEERMVWVVLKRHREIVYAQSDDVKDYIVSRVATAAPDRIPAPCCCVKAARRGVSNNGGSS